MSKYLYSYVLDVRLHTVDDSRDTFYTTSILVDSTYPIRNARNYGNNADGITYPSILNIRYGRNKRFT